MGFLKASWRILTLTCDESTRVMSDSLDAELPLAERLAYRLHALGCRHCRRFLRQIRFLRAATQRLGRPAAAEESPDAVVLPPLSPEARRQIASALRRAHDEPPG
jgi:hypothetical protein